MKRLSSILKIFLGVTLVVVPLVAPSMSQGVDPLVDGDDLLEFSFEDEYANDEWLESLLTEPGFGMEIEMEMNESFSEDPIPADNGHVNEMMFLGDMLSENDQTEIYAPLMRLNSSPTGIASGVVQLVLEPVVESLPSGVTLAQARAAAFNSIHVYHRLYPNATSNATSTGINGMFSRDMLFLAQTGNRYRVMVGGFVGYVPLVGRRHTITVTVGGVNRTFDVTANAEFVPFGSYPATGVGSTQTVSHYVNRNGELFRYLTNNVRTAGGFTRFLTGPAPSWMNQNVRYYSYDGIYFYRNPRNIREDGVGAVNANSPFFNYFQYLSFRSQSTVTAAELDNFLTNQGLHGINTTTSVMRNQGNAFITAQNRYGINALLMYAKAIHESAAGTSSIARNNNNLFGLGAFDATPGQSANSFATPADSINDLANGWLSRGYLWPEDWRYAGPHAGHKGSGMNVRYATDPFWGQKIAGWAFRIDRTRPAANRDLNREQIAIRQNTAPVTVSNANGTTIYTANPNGHRYFAFLVTGTGSNNRLRVQTDPAVVNGMPNRTALYNRADSQGYIPNSGVWLTGAGNPSSPGDVGSGAQTPSGPTARTTAALNLRRGPSTSYNVIRVVPNNSVVSVLGTSANGIWTNVTFGTDTGWVGTEFLTMISGTMPPSGTVPPPTPTQPSTPTPTQPIPEGAALGRTTVAVNLRQGAATSYQLIRVLRAGTDVVVLAVSPNGIWSQVRAGNDTGWIGTEFINITSGTLPGATPAPTTPPPGNNNNNNSNNNTNNAQSATTTAPLNLRRGGGMTYGIIRVLPNNTRVTVLGTNSNGSWTQVRAGNDTGWVSSEFITRAANNTPQPPNNNTPAPPANGTTTGVTTAALNLRRGAGTTHGVIRVLPLGTTMTILTTNNGWHQVQVVNDTGWVSAEFVNTNSGGQNTQQPPAATTRATTTAPLNLRRGSGTTYGIIRVLNQGATVDVLSTTNNGAWTQVRAGNDTGWVSSEFLSR